MYCHYPFYHQQRPRFFNTATVSNLINVAMYIGLSEYLRNVSLGCFKLMINDINPISGVECYEFQAIDCSNASLLRVLRWLAQVWRERFGTRSPSADKSTALLGRKCETLLRKGSIEWNKIATIRVIRRREGKCSLASCKESGIPWSIQLQMTHKFSWS